MNCLEFKSLAERNAWMEQVIANLSQYPYFCLLKTEHFLNELYSDYEIIAGATEYVKPIEPKDFDEQDWLLGGFAYTLKEDLEPECKNYQDVTISFPKLAFFVPEILFWVKINEPLKVFWKGENLFEDRHKRFCANFFFLIYCLL